jgi:hypothetical protein
MRGDEVGHADWTVERLFTPESLCMDSPTALEDRGRSAANYLLCPFRGVKGG